MAVEEVTVQVATPKGMFTGTFPKTAKVADVIAAAVNALQIDGADALELIHNGTSLKPVERPLVSFGLTGTVNLELVATGEGV